MSRVVSRRRVESRVSRGSRSESSVVVDDSTRLDSTRLTRLTRRLTRRLDSTHSTDSKAAIGARVGNWWKLFKTRQLVEPVQKTKKKSTLIFFERAIGGKCSLNTFLQLRQSTERPQYVPTRGAKIRHDDESSLEVAIQSCRRPSVVPTN